MAINPTTPGVYINEIKTLGNAIVPVATAVPAFIGYTEYAKSSPTLGSSDLTNVAVRIESLKDYETIFGGAQKQTVTVTVTDTAPTIALPATPNTRVISIGSLTPSNYHMYYSLQMYFANGGGPCWIVSVKDYPGSAAVADFTGGLDVIAKIDEPTLLVFPDIATSLAVNDFGSVATAALSQCNLLQDRFAILDVPGAGSATNVTASSANILNVKTALGSQNLKYGALYEPYLKTNLNYRIDDGSTLTWTVNAVAQSPATIGALIDNTGLDDPNLYRLIHAEIAKKYQVTLAPSGSIAGIYCAVDRERGVWKAPANVSINNVIAPAVAITEAQQGDLNVDPSTGKSINVIRSFTGKGTLVWGARTLAGNDNEWRYIPVRRLFNMAEESVKKATEAYVFEANDKNTWLNLKSMIGSFLSGLWAQGALVGNKAEQAYFVNVGIGETMTAQDVLEGRLIVRIGMAAVRPAEFIILEFQHTLPTA